MKKMLMRGSEIIDSKAKRFCSKNILIILGFSFIIAVTALIAVGLSQNKPLPENFKYGIVLDAGSSHTNLYIYRWSAEKENNTGLVEQVEECKIKGPGISKYAHRTHDLDRYLLDCMGRSRSVVPKSLQQETPVYLGATAGMRLLSMENEALAQAVLDGVSRSLSNYNFDFQGARIITGQEEGAYGWITINYMLDKFTQVNIHSTHEGGFQGANANAIATADGIWDTKTSEGICFHSYHGSEHSDNFLQFRLYGKDYNVYTHSFLCYGKEEALRQKLAKDIQVSSNGVLKDPCFHLGYEKFVNVSELYKGPCTKAYAKTLPFQQFQVQGAGDYQQCQQSILELFNTSYCPHSRCAFNGVFLPPLQGEFGAFSAFYFVMNFLNLTSDTVSSEEKINEVMETYCARPWAEVKTTFADVNEKFLSEYCFAGAYILSLLLKGYHFPSSSWEDIHFMGKVRGSSAGWTLGYMLNLTNMIPAEQPQSPPLAPATYIFLMVLFSLILAAVIITALVIFKNPSHLWKDTV